MGASNDSNAAIEPRPIEAAAWVHPLPVACDEEYVTGNGNVSLPYIAALQTLRPMERAVLSLYQDAGYSSCEIAQILELDVGKVDAYLSLARPAIAPFMRDPGHVRPHCKSRDDEQRLLSFIIEAFASRTIMIIKPLLTEDVRFTIPSIPVEYRGIVTVCEVIRSIFDHGRQLHVIPTRANGHVTFVEHVDDWCSGTQHRTGLLAVTFCESKISALTRFESYFLPQFGIPRRSRRIIGTGST